MSKHKYGYNARRSFLFGGFSIVFYLALCAIFVYLLWGQTMRNGEPGILTQTPSQQAATTAYYQLRISMWCGGFAVLGMLLFFPYWNLGKSMSDHQQVRSFGRTLRYTSLIIMFNFFLAYVSNCFADDGYKQILNLAQGVISIVILILWVVRGLRHARQKKTRVTRKPI